MRMDVQEGISVPGGTMQERGRQRGKVRGVHLRAVMSMHQLLVRQAVSDYPSERGPGPGPVLPGPAWS